MMNCRRCYACRKQSPKDQLTRCEGCESVYYCSRECEKVGWGVEADVHAHRNWCERMKQYTAATDQLADLPFTLAKETTSPDFDDDAYRRFLIGQGVWGRGLWRREAVIEGSGMPKYGNLKEEEVDNPYILELEGGALLHEVPIIHPSLDMPLQDWSAYYAWRGFSLDSPIAILLTCPLTLYYILTTLLPKYDESRCLVENSDPCIVHILGAEREADMMLVFKEVGMLIPGVNFDIHLIGPHLSKRANERRVEFGNVTVTLHKGLYHSLKLQCPHLAVGFNAGLAAYSGWSATLQKLKENQTPAFFTDYCQYICECSRAPVEAIKLGTISKPEINPFRAPVRNYNEEHDMPQYTNGFVFHLEYT